LPEATNNLPPAIRQHPRDPRFTFALQFLVLVNEVQNRCRDVRQLVCHDGRQYTQKLPSLSHLVGKVRQGTKFCPKSARSDR
jgi:hypothetical protein